MAIRKPDPERIPGDLLGPLRNVCRAIADAGGRAWLVGGSVRDLALDRTTRDLDIEAYGLPPARLQELLERDFALDLVGASFGILKLKDVPIDVSIPRRETKSGRGHQGFLIEADPLLTLPEAAARRDFTINAMSLDPLGGELADPYGGLDDLGRRLLRHTSPAFVEDPLRVLRGMQFCARFELRPAPETVALCRTIDTEGLAAERIFEEWRKLLLLGATPSRGLAFLKDTGWLVHFPELAALPGVQQDPRWHPEGDAWMHTLHCLDAFAAERVGEQREDLIVGLAVLCHDLGKPQTTAIAKDGRLRALGHEPVGVPLTRTFLERMGAGPKLIDEVTPLVAEHMRPVTLHQADASDAAIRRLAVRVGRIDRLIRVARADRFGRPPLPADAFPAGEWLAERARRLGIEAAPPRPLVQGRDLRALGVAEGPSLGKILDQLYRAQIEGKFSTSAEGIERARRMLPRRPPEGSADGVDE